MFTLPETNITPENGPSQKETSISTIHFQVLLLLVSGRVSPLFSNSLCSKPRKKKTSPLLVLPVWCRTNETSMASRIRAAELPSGSGIFFGHRAAHEDTPGARLKRFGQKINSPPSFGYHPLLFPMMCGTFLH